MKRITPEMALEAYRQTGLKPMQGDYFPKEGCACGLGAITKHLHPEAKTETNDDMSKFDGKVTVIFGGNYKSGFAAGFDGVHENVVVLSDVSEKIGYEDGRKVWEAVKHLAEEESK